MHCCRVEHEYTILMSPGELPATIDLARFDQDPGLHKFIVVADSTIGEVAEFIHSYTVPCTLY